MCVFFSRGLQVEYTLSLKPALRLGSQMSSISILPAIIDRDHSLVLWRIINLTRIIVGDATGIANTIALRNIEYTGTDGILHLTILFIESVTCVDQLVVQYAHPVLGIYVVAL